MFNYKNLFYIGQKKKHKKIHIFFKTMADLDIDFDFDPNEFKVEKDLEQGAEKNTIHIRIH